MHVLRWLVRLAKRLVLLALLGWLAVVILKPLFPFPREALRRPPASVLVTDREGGPLRHYVASDEQWFVPRKLDAYSPWLIKATIASEDRRFREHGGVDAIGVCRAIVQNIQRREIYSGASTITMQTVRLLGLRPGRTLVGKAIEAFRAVQLEEILTKDEILTWYLDLAPYGGNVRGAEAAAWRYFGKPASELSIAEAATIAGLPQSPARYRPDRHPEMARGRRDCVLWRMHECGVITLAQYREALREPLEVCDRFAPFAAPHFADAVHFRRSGRSKIRTTISAATQHVAETVLRETASRLRGDGVFNGSVVIVENRTGAILAMVGNVNFFDRDHHGQVNGATARRSPGSALKPFTYALAFEQGIIAPDTVLFDVPSRFTHYRPDNFDRSFLGPIPASRALAASRNVPAVELARRVGIERLHLHMRRLGLRTLTRPASHYGLSLTMGGAEVRLVDLTAAYATFARGGAYLRPRWTVDEAVASPQSVLSAEAAWLVTDCLSRREALADLCPGPAESWPRLALKTGTSQGRRDAWCVGYDPKYTVGVWLGNFDGRRSDVLVGRKVAAPAVVRIFELLYQGRPRVKWFARPVGIGSRRVCALTGLPAGPHCTHSRMADYIPALDRQPRCRVCRRVRRGSVARSEPQWPASVAAWLRANGRETFSSIRESTRPRILSPADGQQFILLADRPASQQRVPLRAAVGGGAETVFWFLDDELLASGAPDQPVHWELAAGSHTLRCVDSRGRWSSVRFGVR